MAIKKNELYSSLWASCDKLRGGMDASQYKDYILTLLFVKYVTDKFKGVKYAEITIPEGGSFDDLVALKGTKNIGEEMDKAIAKLAEANDLRGVIDNAHFNDESKLGTGKEMVDKLTDLISIFQRPEFNFASNKAGGDDILGDAYEYLMRNFATESGKSKGQFYTPAEVSRILAKVIGIDRIEERDEGYSVYDPACGSGSLLIRAANEAPFEISIWGQEKEVTTAGLAKMNLVLHNKAAGEIKAGNTFSSPKFFEEDSNDEVLKRFDFAVANPPFSLKNWTDGLKDYGRFDGYGDEPPEKNGDFAWLMHILKSLKTTGKAAVILPHGVLFRGNAEATIRQSIIDKGYMQKQAAVKIDHQIGKTDAPMPQEKKKQHTDQSGFQPYQPKHRKPGTGCLYQINDHLWEGKYSPVGPDGKRISRNVYAKTKEECEEKLAVMIEEMKKEIEEKRKNCTTHNSGNESNNNIL